MSEAISVEGDVGEMLRRRGVPENVFTLLRLALWSASAPNLLAESAFARETVAHTVGLAESVVGHWQESGQTQPRPRYVKKIHRAAVSACDSLLATAHVPIVSIWQARLGAEHENVVTPVVLPNEWSTFIGQIVTFAWDTPSVPVQTLQRCAVEIGSLVVEQRQSPRLVLTKLSRLLMGKRNAGADPRTAFVECLSPDLRTHVALLGVTGARELVNLRSRVAGATLTQVYPDQQHQFGVWGRAADRVLAFARGVASGAVETGEVRPRSTAPHAFVSVTSMAPDAQAALTASRAALSEALDQYLAAHPSAQLTIEPVAAVADPTLRASFQIDDARGRPMTELTPLEVPWPPRLLIPLRMAAITRSSASPTTRGALAWVTLESAGVQALDESRLVLGKALALAMLRQRLIGAYRQLVADSGTNSERRLKYERRAAVLRKRSRRLLNIGLSVPDVASLHRAAMRWSVVSAMNERLAMLAQEDEASKRERFERLGVSAIRQDGSPSPRLDDFGQWMRLLRAQDAGQPATDGAAALAGLMDLMKPHEHVFVDLMRGRDGAQAELVRRLEDDAAWMEALLEQLYVCRNLHFHSGVHDLSGAAGLGLIGPRIVDLVFEIWATWFSTGSQASAVDVLRHLADRYDDCLAGLQSGRAQPEDLDLKHITGLTWTPAKT